MHCKPVRVGLFVWMKVGLQGALYTWVNVRLPTKVYDLCCLLHGHTQSPFTEKQHYFILKYPFAYLHIKYSGLNSKQYVFLHGTSGYNWLLVLNATFNNFSAMSWRSVLLVEETGENHQSVASHWQSLSQGWTGSWRVSSYPLLQDTRYIRYIRFYYRMN